MKRFENAALLLYNAFNEGTLNQNSCKACAVGNLLGHAFWAGSNNLQYVNDFVSKGSRETIIIRKPDKNTSNYTINELTKIEQIFLDNFLVILVKEEKSKDNQYNALMNVLEYLAELDGITIPEITIEKFKNVLTT